VTNGSSGITQKHRYKEKRSCVVKLLGSSLQMMAAEVVRQICGWKGSTHVAAISEVLACCSRW
jgi:hypothetical protein